jgi:hypothetical protein
MMKRNVFTALLISMVFSGFVGCNPDFDKDEDNGFYFDEKTFSSEWNAWKAKDIKNYSFTMAGELPHWDFLGARAVLMSKYEVNITVKDGTMDSFEYTGNVPQGEDGTIFEPEFTSISDMYEKIAHRASEEQKWWEEYSGEGGFVSTTFVIKYDPQLHYITFFKPVTKVKPDYILDTINHAVAVSDFMVLDN